MMKRLTLFIFIVSCICSHAVAQYPSWAKKAANAVFTLKTFDANGQLVGSTNGFFVGDGGQALSSFASFKGASRAIVIDAQGKEWPVECIIGANDMYDVAKFQVAAKKPQALPVATTPQTQGSSVWLLPYSVKKVPACKKGVVSAAETFQTDYAYYTLEMAYDEQQVNCPILNEAGEVIGMLQPGADAKQTTTSYAVSAHFANDLKMSGLSLNDPTLRATAIAKALPDQQDQALLALFVSSSTLDSLQSADYIERFIQKFPQSPEGYIYRARNLTEAGRFGEADADMNQALKVADKKDDVHYQFAQLIRQKLLLKADHPYEPWTLDLALEHARAAYAESPMPVYRQQQAEILYAQQQYDEAFQIYQELSQTDLRSADLFYAAAQCKLQQQDRDAALAQMDSAVNMFTKPYLKTAAPYLLARAQMLNEAGKYRPAVNDYNDYETLMSAQLGAGFYYLRSQAETNGHLYQQALDDIKRAIEMSPQETLYYAEKASLELRVGLKDDAEQTAKQLLSVAPNDADGYLFLGLAQCMKGQKAEGLKNLQQAKELGNSQAQSLIDKYSK